MRGTGSIRDLVEDATSEVLLAEDWAKNLLICDVVQSYPEEAPQEVCKYLRKRMQEKNRKVQMLTLTLLETLMKNCSFAFHLRVSSDDFQKDLIKVLEKDVKNNGGRPSEVGSKILMLCMSWAEAFERFADDLPNFQSTFSKLRRDGYEFPARNMDEMSPLFTPPARPREEPPRRVEPERYHEPSSNSSNVAKLRNDLEVVRETTGLLNEMIGGAANSEELRSLDLAVEMFTQVKEMKQRIVRLIEEMPVADEHVIALLFSLNDDLDIVISRYESKLRDEPDPNMGRFLSFENVAAMNAEAHGVLQTDFLGIGDVHRDQPRAPSLDEMFADLSTGDSLPVVAREPSEDDDLFGSIVNRHRDENPSTQGSRPAGSFLADDRFPMRGPPRRDVPSSAVNSSVGSGGSFLARDSSSPSSEIRPGVASHDLVSRQPSQLSESGDEFDSFLLSRSTKSSGVSNSGSASQAPQLSPRRREQLERNADDFFAL